MRVLETPRLQLRPMMEADEAFYCGLYTDAAVMQHIALPLSVEAAQAAFAKACRLNRDTDFRYRTWIIIDKASHANVGLMALIRDGDAAEIGTMLARDSQGKGITVEVLPELIDFGFGECGVASMFARSARALGILNKFGFGIVRGDPQCSLANRRELSRQQWLANARNDP